MRHPLVQSLFALVAGYFVLAVLTGALAFGLAIAFGIDRAAGGAAKIPTLFSVVYLLASACAAGVAGCLTAYLAPSRLMLHGWILGGFLFMAGSGYQVLQVLRGLAEPRAEPLWFLLLLPVVGLLSVAAGAYFVESRHADA